MQIGLRIGLYAACIVALAIVISFVHQLRQTNLEREQLRLESQAEALTLSFQRRINVIFDSLNNVAALFEGSYDVTAFDFNRYLDRANILTAVGRPRAVAIMPLLERDDLEVFKRQMAAREQARAALGYPPFTITVTDDRDVYAPVVLVESREGRDGIINYDLATNEDRLSAARRALETGEAHMTRPVQLSQDSEDGPVSVLIVAAIEADDSVTLSPDAPPLAGRNLIIAAGFTPSLALRDLIERKDKANELRFVLKDTTEENHITLLRSFAPKNFETAAVIDTVVFGDRLWTFSYYHDDHSLEALGLDHIVVLGLIGVALVVALTIALDRLLRNRTLLEREVDNRTEALRESNAALTLAVSQANAESEAKSNFLARMSHDLRTPLNAVIGYAQFISSEIYGRLDERRYVEYAKTIEEAGRIQLQLVEEILALTALQSGARTFEHENLQLDQTVRQSVEIVQLKAREKGIDVAVLSTLEDQSVLGDAASIQQILLNLLTNAIKFTEPGGTVTVRTDPRYDGGFKISVVDTGIGISGDDIESIMRPFSKSKSNPYTTDEGVGLGLTIVKTLVEANGGQVTIESELGLGTSVSVSFPRRQDLAADD